MQKVSDIGRAAVKQESWGGTRASAVLVHKGQQTPSKPMRESSTEDEGWPARDTPPCRARMGRGDLSKFGEGGKRIAGEGGELCRQGTQKAKTLFSHGACWE